MSPKVSQKPYSFVGIDGKKFTFATYDPMIPTAIYLRISQDRDAEGNGVARQLKDCAAYAALHRLTVTEVIEENDTSAYVAPHDETKKPRKAKRPGFEHLLNNARSGEIHAVVAWATDRLWRSVRDLDRLINIVHTTPHHFTIHAIKGGIIGLDDPHGQAVARILSAVAQSEVDIKSVRQSSAHKQAFEKGKFSGGRVPFGYKLGEKEGELIVHKTQSEVLLDIADGILKDGWSITKATRYIREELPIRCGKMRPIALRNILTGPTVAGKRCYLPVRVKATGQKVGTYGPASWEAIFDERTWNLLRSALIKPVVGRPTRISLLAGLLICAYCGGRMGYSAESYKCSITSGCGRMSITTKNVESEVTEYVTTILSGAENQDLLKKLLGIGDGPPGTKGVNYDAELEEISKQVIVLTKMHLKGQLSLPEVEVLIEDLRKEEANLLKERDASVAQAVAWERAHMAYQQFEDLLDKTDEDSIAAKNVIFRAVLDGVVVSPRQFKGCKFDPSRLEFRIAGMSPYVPMDEREHEGDDGITWWTEDPGDLSTHPSARDLIDAGIVKEPVPRRRNRKAERQARQAAPVVDTRLTNEAYEFEDDEDILRGDILMR